MIAALAATLSASLGSELSEQHRHRHRRRRRRRVYVYIHAEYIVFHSVKFSQHTSCTHLLLAFALFAYFEGRGTGRMGERRRTRLSAEKLFASDEASFASNLLLNAMRKDESLRTPDSN